eukprot:5964740-Prymnesium_polylepis.1
MSALRNQKCQPHPRSVQTALWLRFTRVMAAFYKLVGPREVRLQTAHSSTPSVHQSPIPRDIHQVLHTYYSTLQSNTERCARAPARAQ